MVAIFLLYSYKFSIIFTPRHCSNSKAKLASLWAYFFFLARESTIGDWAGTRVTWGPEIHSDYHYTPRCPTIARKHGTWVSLGVI